MTSNDILRCHLNDDVIYLINEYVHGDRKYWKGKYEQVADEMKKEGPIIRKSNEFFANKNGFSFLFRTSLVRDLSDQFPKKINCIFSCYEVMTDSCKTLTINDCLDKYGVIGIYRVMFDNIVFKLKQITKIASIIRYRININNKAIYLNINSKLLRHLHDYNYCEYDCYVTRDSKRWTWQTKMNWGDLYIQMHKRDICSEIRNLKLKKQMIEFDIEQAKTNMFEEGYKLRPYIEIIKVNNKTIRISVKKLKYNKTMLKQINKNKISERIYIIDPITKSRLYADEKYKESHISLLYQNM